MTSPALLAQYLDFVGEHRDLEGARVLDIGCGTSHTWRSVAERGARYVGVEPSAAARRQTRAAGVDVRSGIPAHGPDVFDVALLIEVVEHTYSPLDLMADARTSLSPSGLVYVATPNALSLRARFGNENWDQAQNPTHVCLFSRKALEETLVAAGFATIAWQRWIRNPDPLPRRLVQRGLQVVGLDGGLRVLARRAP